MVNFFLKDVKTLAGNYRKQSTQRNYLVYTKDLRKDGPILLIPVFMTMCLDLRDTPPFQTVLVGEAGPNISIPPILYLTVDPTFDRLYSGNLLNGRYDSNIEYVILILKATFHLYLLL